MIFRDFYDKEYDGTRGTNVSNYRVRKAIEFINKIRPDIMLSVGCAKGDVEKHIVCKEIHGIDISLANRRNATFFCKEVYDFDLNLKIPLHDNTYDIIWCGEVIEHIFDTDNLINEMYRMLKPNGYLVLTTPNISAWSERLASILGWTPICSQCSNRTHGQWFKKPVQLTIGHISPFNTIAMKRTLRLSGFRDIKFKPSTDFKNKILVFIDLFIGIMVHYSLTTNIFVTARK